MDPAIIDRVTDEVDRRRDELVAFAADLIRIPSETHPPGGDEGPVQRFIEAKLRDIGLDVDVFEPWSVPGALEHPGWWPGLEYDDRPNVVGVWTGAAGGRSLILNGHCDVVPAGPHDLWTHDPYGGVVADGRIYGRGASDQKGGIAAMIMAVEVLRHLGLSPRGDVIVESVVNEELGGYNGTVACCAKGYLADAAIVTEPTQLEIVAATEGRPDLQGDRAGRQRPPRMVVARRQRPRQGDRREGGVAAMGGAAGRGVGVGAVLLGQEPSARDPHWPTPSGTPAPAIPI